MKKWIIAIGFLVLAFVFTGCPGNQEPEEFEILNEWIWDGMNEVYLWNEDIDQALYPTEETDPERFFYSLLDPRDNFSWIVDDVSSLENSFAGIERSVGITPFFVGIGNDEVVAVVMIVAEGSPADSAGIERGDIITDVNGSPMTTGNYRSLYYQEEVTFNFADFIDGALYKNDRVVSLATREIDQNPVHYAEIIDYEGSRIAYLVYNQFTSGTGGKWQLELDNALLDFQSDGFDHMVIDLRYNPGGSIYMATRLASSLVPSTISTSESVFVYLQWNDLFVEYIEETEGEDSPYLVSFFEEDPAVNLELNEVYFLTSIGTASASELTIIGLEPYVDDVITIGDTTVGKPFGSITVEDFEDPPRHTWAMQPIVFRYANAVGFSDFANGLAPDHYVPDNIIAPKPFGDITDPMLARALELITGVAPVTKKAAGQSDLTPLPDPVRQRKSRAVLDLPG